MAFTLAAASSSSPAMTVVLFALMASVVLSDGAVFKVGDTVGWTILGSPNYTAWAASKTFNVGDTVVFEYNKAFHNVMEVNKTDYKGCNTASPRVTYTTGNDTIKLKRKGHHYFICGIPGHCSLEQKVDIRIPKLVASSASSPLPSKSPSTSPAPVHPGSNASGNRNGVVWTFAVIGFTAFAGLIMA